MSRTQVVDATIDTLSPIDNGPTLPRPKVKRPKPKQGFGPIVEVRPAFGPWGCDDCSTPGKGLAELKAHHEATGHTHYTDTAWLGL